ncbi:MAG: response regulator [Actinomycetota bacterium]
MSGTVLVLGRDETAAAFLTALLERGGIAARAGHPDAAATRTVDDAPSLVLVDTDLTAVQAIRALDDAGRATVPIVVLGAETPGPAAAEMATQAGATHYVPRPIVDSVLINGVRMILDAG